MRTSPRGSTQPRSNESAPKLCPEGILRNNHLCEAKYDPDHVYEPGERRGVGKLRCVATIIQS